MPPEDDDYSDVVRDSPSEGSGEAGVAELAREGQTKSDDQQDQEKQQEVSRKNYDTASSVNLPKIDLDFEDGGLVVKIGDNQLRLGSGDDRGVHSGIQADVPLGEVEIPEAPPVADGGMSADLPLGAVSPEHAQRVADAQSERDSAEGAIGDRSKDSGLGKFTKPEFTTDEQGRLTDYKLPDGTKYEIEYGLLGTPSTLTITPEGGTPVAFERNWAGIWRDAGGNEMTGKGVTFDSSSKHVTIHLSETDITLAPNGSYEDMQRLYHHGGKPNARIDADGTTHTYDNDAGTESVTGPGSHISEVRALAGGGLKAYELRDDQGHLTKIEINEDGTAGVSKGDGPSRGYLNVERASNGDLKLSNADNSSLEIRQDGTALHRNGDNKVTSIINSDGETTTFERNSRGKVAGLSVVDGQGHEVEKRTSGIEVDDQTGNYKVTLTKAEAESRQADGTEGTAKILERKADGTERLLAKDGTTEIQSDADKLLDKFKNYTDEQRLQLRQDLTDIDKLPQSQREAVYESLDRIARNDEHPDDKIKLTGQQARELVASLAHQIAHPESIEQGAHETCAAANMEQIAARSHPEVYADMVASLATEGEYRTAGGRVIHAETHDGKLDAKGDVSGQRSYASELFQDSVVDLAVQMGDPPRRYKSLALDSPDINPRPEGVTPANDYGERLIDPANPDAAPEQFVGLNADKQLKALKELFPEDSYGNRPINNKEDLIQAFKDNEQGPMKVAIGLEGETFTGMGDESGSLTGEHAIVVTQIKDDLVYFENTAGGKDRSYPHGEGVPIEEFVTAMKAAEKGAYVRGEWPSGTQGGTAEGSMGTPQAAASDAAPPAPADAQPARAAGEPGRREDLQKKLDEAEAERKPTQSEAAAETAKDPVKVAEQIRNIMEDSRSPELDIRNGLKDMTPEQVAKVKEELQKKWGVNLYEILPEMEKRDKALESIKGDPEVKEDRERLEKLAAEKIKNPEERKQFLENMQKFEGNVAFQQQEYQKELEAKGMSQADAAKEAEKRAHDQVEKSYENMERLLQTNKDAKIPEADRVTLAKQTMQHMGDPKSISQGNHGTCNAATVETRTFAKDPAEATRMIADVATTGKYTTKTGLTVDYSQDLESLKKHGESQEVPPKERVDGHRDYASQIFQVTAFNVALERENQSTDPKGHKRLIQHKEVAGKNPPPDDNGDYVVDPSKNDPETGKPPLKVRAETGMVDLDISGMAKDISPHLEGPTVVENGEKNVTGLERQLIALEMRSEKITVTDDKGNAITPDHPDYCKRAREAIKNKEGLDDGRREKLNDLVNDLERHTKLEKEGGVLKVNNEAEMHEALAKAKREGKLPIIVSVNTNTEPFWTDSGGGTAGGSGGGHVVTITDYDEQTGMASMQNQWSRGDSHNISAGDLFKASRDPEKNLADLQKDVDDARTSGKPDYQKEYELLSFQRRLGKITDEQFDQKFADLAVERYKQAKESGQLGTEEYRKASRQAAKTLEELEDLEGGPDRAKKIREDVGKRVAV